MRNLASCLSFFTILIFCLNCQKGSKGNDGESTDQVIQEAKADEQNQAEEAAKSENSQEEHHPQLANFEIANQFCASLKHLELKGDGFGKQFDLLCQNDQSTFLFNELATHAYAGEGDFDHVKIIEAREDEAVELSYLRVAFALKLPVSVTEIKDREIYQVLTQGLDFERHKVKIELGEKEGLEGLHYAKQNVKYDTEIIGPQSAEFINTRTTEVNQYQIIAGNDDLGMATEHLLDAEANPDYQYANTVNITLKDPASDGSYLISVVDFVTWNKGFFKTNVKSLIAITKEQAKVVYGALSTRGDQ